MALYKDPVTTLLEVIERENGVTLDPADYDFGTPTPATPPEGSSASYNTQIAITANNVAAPYAGSIELFYNRLDLADLGDMVSMYIRSPLSTTTHDIIPALNRRFGLNLTQADIVLRDTIAEEGYKTAQLTATEGSIGWIGEITVSVAEGDVLLEDHLVNTALGGLNYPTEYPTKTFAQVYSYWRDFSEHHDYLTALQAGDAMSLDLAAVLHDVTGDDWLASGAGDFSLGNATITFSGDPDDTSVANDDYDHVVIIALDVGTCLGMTGDLVLHSSAPQDPNTV